MARRKRGGAAARARDSGGKFSPKRRSPTKRGSPQKKSTSPGKPQESQQQDTVDEGIAATPDDTPLQPRVEDEDSTYDSSPQKQTSSNKPPQTPVRKNAARCTRSNKAVVDQDPRSPEAGPSQKAGDRPPSISHSNVVVLKVARHKLRQITRAHSAPEKKVIFKVSPEKLRSLQQTPVAGDLAANPPQEPGQPEGGGSSKMAPVKDKNPHDILDDQFKDVIQNLYDIASITHGYLPESQGPLVNKSLDLTRSLAALSDLTAENSIHPAAPTIRSILIPPEVIDYVANGRNPDIYTREFVENVQRGNYVLNGKMQAFGSFAEMYARETKSAMPEMAGDMDRLMEHSGGFEKVAGSGDWKMKKAEARGS